VTPVRSPAVRFRLLGPIEVSGRGGPVGLGGPKPRRLLAALLVRHGRRASVDELVEVLWGEHPPGSARGLIHTYVSTLRRLFADMGVVVELTRTGNSYQIRCDAGWLDVPAFEDAVRRATEANKDGRHGEAARTAWGALKLWLGTPFDGLAQGFLIADAARLVELRRQAMDQYATAEIMLGRGAVVVPELRGFVDEYPLCERLREVLVTALFEAGRNAAALAAYEDARQVLATELGARPGRRLMELHRGIRAADLADVVPVPHQLPPVTFPDTGRQAGLHRIMDRLLARPAPPVVVLCGPAGIGKTALAVQAGHLTRAHFPDGQLFADLSTRPGTHVVLSRFLIAMGVDSPSTLDELAVSYRSALADRRILVVLDGVTDAEQVRPLLGGAAVVITSRRPLAGIAADHVHLTWAAVACHACG
jgi:DNA-binding SARP family transcriptional activator